MVELSEELVALAKKLRGDRFSGLPVTLIAAENPPIRCRKCQILLTGQPILALVTDKGWQCAEREVCKWRRQREFEKRQLSLPFMEE